MQKKHLEDIELVFPEHSVICTEDNLILQWFIVLMIFLHFQVGLQRERWIKKADLAD